MTDDWRAQVSITVFVRIQVNVSRKDYVCSSIYTYKYTAKNVNDQLNSVLKFIRIVFDNQIKKLVIFLFFKCEIVEKFISISE